MQCSIDVTYSKVLLAIHALSSLEFQKHEKYISSKSLHQMDYIGVDSISMDMTLQSNYTWDLTNVCSFSLFSNFIFEFLWSHNHVCFLGTRSCPIFCFVTWCIFYVRDWLSLTWFRWLRIWIIHSTNYRFGFINT